MWSSSSLKQSARRKLVLRIEVQCINIRKSLANAISVFNMQRFLFFISGEWYSNGSAIRILRYVSSVAVVALCCGSINQKDWIAKSPCHQKLANPHSQLASFFVPMQSNRIQTANAGKTTGFTRLMTMRCQCARRLEAADSQSSTQREIILRHSACLLNEDH